MRRSKMSIKWGSVCILAATLLITPIHSSVCPTSCRCGTTRDGLHRAACSDIAELYKFTLRQRHHNINILDLSHNNITKLNHELDRLTEVVTLDLSTNGIVEINKFLHNSKKLVHLSLANNRIKDLSLTHLPASVSSLDLTNNLLHDIPSDLRHLSSLEHLELEGNPLDCSCANIKARDHLLSNNVFIDHVICFTPLKLKGKSWLELKTKDICQITKVSGNNMLDMMMGDQPMDAIRIGHETTKLKSMPLLASSDLDDGEVLEGTASFKDDDDVTFIKADKEKYKSHLGEIEGSGDIEVTTISDLELEKETRIDLALQEKEHLLLVEDHTTEDPLEEGSGIEGSGFGIFNNVVETSEIPTTTEYQPFYTGPIQPYFTDNFFSNDTSTSTEFPMPPPVTIFRGGKDWIDSTVFPTTEKISTTHIPKDATVSEQIRVTRPVEVNGSAGDEEKQVTHKTGTYVCIALIVVLLVGLIGFAIIKGQMRKRRDRRLIRQQRRDVEKDVEKEMVDMNKSLLGKAASVESPIARKQNGKYELVPTHESFQKKGENGDIANGVKHNDINNVKGNSPKDTNQNKSSSRDNNLNEETNFTDPPQYETLMGVTPTSPDSKEDTHSLSSEDIFVPLNDYDQPRMNGVTDSMTSQPLLNSNQISDSDYLSPSREYVPVYSPDMGRVRIKLTETPKPTTPVLVTRSRSNAGDIIVTPAVDANNRKSTT